MLQITEPGKAEQRLDDSRFSIYVAANEDGEGIKNLVQECGFPTDYNIDWSDIYPYWLVAKVNGELIGCIQIALSKPIGRLEMLGVKKDLSPVARAKVVKLLLLVAKQTLLEAGVTLASAMITFDFKCFKKIIKRRGGRNFGAGNIFLWEIK